LIQLCYYILLSQNSQYTWQCNSLSVSC